jgi:hypothetical protein
LKGDPGVVQCGPRDRGCKAEKERSHGISDTVSLGLRHTHRDFDCGRDDLAGKSRDNRGAEANGRHHP